MASYSVKTPPQHGPWKDFLDVWRAADDIEVFTTAWNFDHFYPLTGDTDGPCLEGWTMLAALARRPGGCELGSVKERLDRFEEGVTCIVGLLSQDYTQAPASWQATSAVLDEHCALIGRDPSEIERSIHLPWADDDDPGALAERAAALSPPASTR